MDLLPSILQDLSSFCSRRLTVKTVLALADHMISRIAYVHMKSLRHSKPDNFLIGSGCHCFYSILISVWPESTEMTGQGSTYYTEQVIISLALPVKPA